MRLAFCCFGAYVVSVAELRGKSDNVLLSYLKLLRARLKLGSNVSTSKITEADPAVAVQTEVIRFLLQLGFMFIYPLV